MKRNYFNRTIALLLVLVLMLAGCTAAKPGTTTEPAQTTVPAAPEQTTAANDATVAGQDSVEGKEITFFSVNLNPDGMTNHYMMAYPNDDGTAYVEYVGDVKKIGEAMDVAVMEQVAAALVQSGMADLNGQEVYGDGAGIASAYVEYSDGSVVMVSFGGDIPQAYQDAYAKLEAGFQALTAELEVYVPMPMIADDVDAAAKDELMAILQASGIVELDMFQISNVVKDDSFGFMMGLSSAEGIAVGTNCGAMMITTPYSLVIATLEEGADAEAIRNDFVNSLDWQKWVCVMPTGALVAQKGNMVLCLMGADGMYDQTVQAITDCGWENLEAIDSPVA